MAIFRGSGSASTTSDSATVDTVTQKAAEAATSASNAASSASSAASSASSASSSASTATTQASNASTSATSAASSASSASTSATNASTSATAAASSASAASSSETAAETAETNAETAQAAAESAQTAAETAQTGAETALASAETVLASTQAVYDDFDDRYLGAKTSEPTLDNDGNALIDGALFFDTTNSQMKVYDLSGTQWVAFSLTPAQLASVDTVADNIADVNTVATNIADIQAAQTSATNAATSATASATSATASATSATASASSATAAASSAASAATALDSFDDRYLGAKSSAPTTDNDGDPLVQGALYYDTTQGSMYVYEGSSWIKASASIVDTWDEFVFTATSGQTAFTGADDNTNTLVTSDYMIVTRNGVRLTEGVGYTVTTGTVTLATGAATGDIITITAFASLQVADTLSLSQGGTVTGAVTFNGNVDGIAFSEIDSTPTTLAGYGITDAATSAQGALADSATQPGDLATVATTGAYSDLTGSPTAVSSFTNDSGYLTDIVGDTTPQLGGDLDTNGNAITGSTVAINASNGDLMINATEDGPVSLRYDGNLKLSTKSDGVNITGEIEADSLDIDGVADFTGKTTHRGGISLLDNDVLTLGTSDDLQIYHNGTNNLIQSSQQLNIEAASGDVVIRGTDNIYLQGSTANETFLKADEDGAVTLYHNNNSKLATTSTGIAVTGEVDFGDWTVVESAGVLYFKHNGTNKMKLDSSGNLTVTGNVTAYGSV